MREDAIQTHFYRTVDCSTASGACMTVVRQSRKRSTTGADSTVNCTTSGFDGGAEVDSQGRDVAGDLATSAGILTTRLIIVTCNGAVAFGALNGERRLVIIM
jgi:hypothetical protein